MNVLFLCQTSYQVFVAARIKQQFHHEDQCDIIIFDTIARYDKLASSLLACQSYRKVFQYSYRKKKRRNEKKLLDFLYPVFYQPKITFDVGYEYIYYGNIGSYTLNSIMKKAMLRGGARKTSFNIFEDGFSTYTRPYGMFFNSLKSENKVKHIYHYFTLLGYLHTRRIYVFSPELMEWTSPLQIVPISKISWIDNEYKQEINAIFQFSQMEDDYKQKYIFFEESYYADGFDIGDIEIVEKIGKIIGKQNLLVKIHPRNAVNRFKELGYCTNSNTEIPWEVISLNIDLADKILITVASGSALTSLVNLKSRPKKIVMLMNCREIDDRCLTPSLPSLRRVAEKYPDIVFLPTCLTEAFEFFKKEENIV